MRHRACRTAMVVLPVLGLSVGLAPSVGCGDPPVAGDAPAASSSHDASLGPRTEEPVATAVVSSSSPFAPPPSDRAAPTPAPTPARVAPRPASLPPISDGESARPTVDEWKAASPVLEVRGCTATVVREWARLRCPEALWVRTSPWGRPGVDYREDWPQGAIEVRLRRGALLQAQSSSTGVRFVMAWPTTDDQPWQLTLEAPRTGGGREPWPTPMPVPEVPRTDAPRPPEADWVAAVPVNTARAEPLRECGLSVRGSWARLRCRPEDSLASLRTWEVFTGFGEKKVDHVESMLGIAGDELQLDFRLRPGGRAHGMVLWATSGRRASVKYEWPEGAPGPTVLSLVEIEAPAP